MTREQIKTLLPVINAFSEGKSVQIKRAGAWIEKDSLYFDEEPENYRIKPSSPQFRPWTAEEAIPQIGKTLLRYKRVLGAENTFPVVGMILGVSETHIVYGMEGHHQVSFQEVFEKVEHSTDNGKTFHPCGVQISGEGVA